MFIRKALQPPDAKQPFPDALIKVNADDRLLPLTEGVFHALRHGGVCQGAKYIPSPLIGGEIFGIICATDGKAAREKKPFTHIGDSFRKVVVVKGKMPLRIDERGYAIIGVIDFLLDPGKALGT